MFFVSGEKKLTIILNNKISIAIKFKTMDTSVTFQKVIRIKLMIFSLQYS